MEFTFALCIVSFAVGCVTAYHLRTSDIKGSAELGIPFMIQGKYYYVVEESDVYHARLIYERAEEEHANRSES